MSAVFGVQPEILAWSIPLFDLSLGCVHTLPRAVAFGSAIHTYRSRVRALWVNRHTVHEESLDKHNAEKHQQMVRMLPAPAGDGVGALSPRFPNAYAGVGLGAWRVPA